MPLGTVHPLGGSYWGQEEPSCQPADLLSVKTRQNVPVSPADSDFRCPQKGIPPSLVL